MSEAAQRRCTPEWRRMMSVRQITELDPVKVSDLYAEGKTQKEIAVILKVSQKVIWRHMRTNGIKARPAAKRNQSGDANDSWKGRNATYHAVHRRVVALYGKPKKCEWCGSTNKRFYDWACTGMDYFDVKNFTRLCRSCHRHYDNQRKQKPIPPPVRANARAGSL